MLRPIAENLWDCNRPMVVLGMHLGHRLTAIRLPGGALWVHSPVEYTRELAAELAALGPVAHLVAPNFIHDTYLEGWLPRYPDARFWAPRGFHACHPALGSPAALEAAPPAAWGGVIDALPLQGMPRVEEVVFRHGPTRTLIVADLAFNLGGDMPLLSRTLLRLNGCYGCFAASRLLKSTIRDRPALRASIDRLLAWDFDRVIVSHGANLETGGREALREAFAFL